MIAERSPHRFNRDIVDAVVVEDEDLIPANLDSIDRAARFVERKAKELGGPIAG